MKISYMARYFIPRNVGAAHVPPKQRYLGIQGIWGLSYFILVKYSARTCTVSVRNEPRNSAISTRFSRVPSPYVARALSNRLCISLGNVFIISVVSLGVNFMSNHLSFLLFPLGARRLKILKLVIIKVIFKVFVNHNHDFQIVEFEALFVCRVKHVRIKAVVAGLRQVK